jgi:beta-glucosidase
MKGRTYRYSKAEPLYGFGYGLSYTKFALSAPAISSAKIAAGDALLVNTKVTNTGSREGDEVVEVYLVPPASEIAPSRELVGFQRVHLQPNENREVQIKIDPRQLSQVDASGKRAIEAGAYKVYVGGGQPSADAKGLALEIVGSKGLPE